MDKSKMMFTRGNRKKVKYGEMVSHIADFILKDIESHYDLTVGTDSQNADNTKMVEVIDLHRIGDGGIFFYRTEFLPRISSIKQKITTETSRSLELADGLVDSIDLVLADSDLCTDDLNVSFQIHCDIGSYGKTKALIPEIINWVTICGYLCAIKPDSYCASGIANKFSKF